MPIYEYRCPQCGHQFEKLVRGFGGSGEVKCPSCGAESERQVSLFGFGVSGGSREASGGCAPSPAGGG